MAHEMSTTELRRMPPICEVWLAVEEEQTLKLGMRRAWHWLEELRPAHGGRHDRQDAVAVRIAGHSSI